MTDDTETFEGTPPDAEDQDQLADGPDPGYDDIPDDDDDETPLADEDTDAEDDQVDDDTELAQPPDGDEARTVPDAPE